MARNSFGSQYLSRRHFDQGMDHLTTPYELSSNSYTRTQPWLDADLRECYLGEHIDTLSHIGKDGFQVSLDVIHFQPNEISVNIENNSVVVHAVHEEKRDHHGHISREFTRRYELPDGYKVEEITSNLSSDGILTIKAPRMNPTVVGKYRNVPITHTGPARLYVAPVKDKNEDEVVENKCEE